MKVAKVLVAQSCPTLAIPCTVARQAPLPMDFSRQEYWSGLPFPSPGNLPYPGIEPESPALQADSLPSKPPWKPPLVFFISLCKLVTETNGILFYFLSLVIIGCQWRKKRMRRYAGT